MKSSPPTPITSQSYQKAYENAINLKNYQSALKISQHIQIKDVLTSHNEAASILTNLKLYDDLFLLCEQSLKTIDEDDSFLLLQRRFTMVFCLLHLNKIKDARDILKQIQSEFNSCQKNLSKELVNQIKDKIFSAQTSIERFKEPTAEKLKEEALQYKQIMDDERVFNDLKEEGKTVWLIPISWFNKWKEYTQFSSLFEAGDSMVDESSNKVQSNQNLFPGPINPKDILEKAGNENQLLEIDEKLFHQNYVLKQNLRENNDFMIATEPMKRFFYNLYGGIEIKRQTILNPVTNEVNVDLFYKKITFIPLPAISSSQVKESIFHIYAPKFQSIQDLIEKIKRATSHFNLIDYSILNRQYYKFFRLPSELAKSYSQCVKSYLDKQKDLSIFLNVKPLSLSIRDNVDDMEISDSDIFLLELSDSDRFKITPIYIDKKSGDQNFEKAEERSQKLPKYTSSSTTQMKDEESEQKEDSENIYPTGEVNAKTMNEAQHNMIKKNFSMPPPFRGFSGKKGVTGLQNLGNTCFMNSALQCLSNVEELTTFLLKNDYLADLNPTNVLGAEGKLAHSYAGLMRAMWTGSDSYVSAHEFKKVIGKFSPRFYGYAQQDSQELLSYLLDGLHEDLNRIKKKPQVDSIDYNSDPSWTEEEQRNKDSEMAIKFFANYKKRNDSVISDLMVGQFKSTLVCPKCKRVSIIFDPYLMLSVPIATPQLSKIEKIDFFLVLKDFTINPWKLSPHLRLDLSVEELKIIISKEFRVPSKNLILVSLNKFKLETIISNSDTIETVYNLKGNTFIFEIENPVVELSAIKQNVPTSSGMEIENDKPEESITKSEENQEQKVEGSGEEAKEKVIEQEKEEKLEVEGEEKIIQNVLLEVWVQSGISLDLNKELSSNDISSLSNKQFSRLLSIPHSHTIQQMVQQVYSVMRFYLNRLPRSENPVEIDMTNSSVETLTKELASYSQQDNTKILKFFTQDYTPLDINSQKTILSLSQPQQQHIIIKLLFNSEIDFKSMKLLTCSDHSVNVPTSASSNQSKQRGYVLQDCIESFIQKEQLGKGNEWFCSSCKDHVLATKQMQIHKTPKILIIHLKRFRSSAHNYGKYYFESSGKKITDEIDFPISDLDMTKYVLGSEGKQQIYELFAVSQHYGGMGGGHYTACAKNFLDKKWYNFNDSHASSSNANSAVSSAAYVLFYRRKD